MVQWLKLCVPNAGGPSSIPGQETRSHMPQLKIQLRLNAAKYIYIERERERESLISFWCAHSGPLVVNLSILDPEREAFSLSHTCTNEYICNLVFISWEFD